MRSCRTHSPRRGQRGNLVGFFILLMIPLLCLPFLVGNTGTMAARASRAQATADHIALSTGTLWARGINRIEENNLQIAFAAGFEIAALAFKDTLEDCENTAWSLAAAFWWFPPMSALYSIYGRAIKATRTVLDPLLAFLAGGARAYIQHLGRDSRRILRTYPSAVAGLARQIAADNGGDVVAVLPSRGDWMQGLLAGLIDPPDVPLYPMRSAKLARLCPYLDQAGPGGRETRGGFVTQWGWSRSGGTLDYWEDNLLAGGGVSIWVDIVLVPVAGPMHWRARRKQHLDRLCNDNTRAPALFTQRVGTTTVRPLVGELLDRLGFTVVVLDDHAFPWQAPLLAVRGDTFREPQSHGIAAVSRVEIVNADSMDGTVAAHRARLTAAPEWPRPDFVADGTNTIVEKALIDLADGDLRPEGVSAAERRRLRRMALAFRNARRADGDNRVRH